MNLLQTMFAHHAPQLAYIGPGAGFALLGSFLSLIAGIFLSVVSLLLWPLRMMRRLLARRKGFRNARVKKIVFIGLDGLDPRLTERFMAEGKMPNLARLAESGSYSRLRTTFPSLSPVAWSTFATGVNPAKHNIFDFLDRNLRSYVPQLSSARVGKPQRIWKIGRLRIPLSSPTLELRRKSEPFWRTLGKHGIACTILRVPITFPPEKFDGKMLSAMSTPDMKGTQGSFSQFTTRVKTVAYESGDRYPLVPCNGGFHGEIEGPEDAFIEGAPALRVPFHLAAAADGALELRVQEHRCRLVLGEYTNWLQIGFRSAIGTSVSGIVRFLLTETAEHCSLYMSPINIDPASPALPISYPSYYAKYLANLLGPFATTGMAEDTWALNEGVIDEDAFLQQAYDIFDERQAMFLDALAHTGRGVVACVFDTSDRVQHMFFRHLGQSDRHAGVIENLYRRMDCLIGQALPFADSNTALFVLSDHGFCAFRRGVNLNSWLRDHGYLHLKEHAKTSARFFEDVDWTRTRAYALGLSGLYLNLRGRESQGIVAPEEADRLKPAIVTKLAALRDDDGASPIRTVYQTSAIYSGPYLDAAPDLIVGYHDGYRVSWESAVGAVPEFVIEDNDKAWSGDHCVDPVLVPGVLFSNRRIDNPDPGIEDLAPTAMSLFGLKPSAWMEGKALL
ncbi:MAG TPA: alkaline phosphatase family protein [Bryobacteraceae bacterium]|nr:alkaline phosphatase family protein [Bryobacteraceae bacterium]